MPKFHHQRPTREASPAPQRAKPAEPAPTRAASLRHLAPGTIVQRVLAAPHSLRPAELMAMQRTLGNRASGAMLGRASIQPKLIVNAPGDEYEREADRVADAVMRVPAVAREETPRSEHSPEVMTKPASEHGGDGSFAAGEDFGQRLQASQGRGRPLPPALRDTFETRFGADFSSVRVHSDAAAGQLSQDIQAQAFTRGSDIFLGAGQSAAATTAGKRLLAHELTHVVQQGAAPLKTATAPQQVTQPTAAGSKLAGQIQRKLDWQNTAWGNAKKAWASAGGGAGVLFVTDKPNDAQVDPVVVKTGENAAAETVLAANLYRSGKGKWSAYAPGARVVTPDEGSKIKQAAVNWQISEDDKRAKGIIDGVDKPGAVVYEFAHGKEFKTASTDEFKAKFPQKEFDLNQFETFIEESKTAGKKPFTDKSPLLLLQNAKFVTSLGFTSALDIFTGNWDRLTNMYNPENFMVDMGKKQIALIDNVNPNTVYAFKNYSHITAEQAFSNWRGGTPLDHLSRQQFSDLATKILKNLKWGIGENLKVSLTPDQSLWLSQIAGSPSEKRRYISKMTKASSELSDIIEKKIEFIFNSKKGTKITEWLIKGLTEGRARLIQMNEADIEELTEGMSQDDKAEVQESIRARIDYLRDPDTPKPPFVARTLPPLPQNPPTNMPIPITERSQYVQIGLKPRKLKRKRGGMIDVEQATPGPKREPRVLLELRQGEPEERERQNVISWEEQLQQCSEEELERMWNKIKGEPGMQQKRDAVGRELERRSSSNQ
jgi:hypothetical protein